MKATLRTWLNACVTAVLGLIGFSSCEPVVAYGVPSGDLAFKGKVVNEEQERLSHIQIVRRGGWQDNIPQMYWAEYADTLYTDAYGEYYKESNGDFPFTYHHITATDLSGVYESKDTIVSVSYNGGNGWYEGTATLQINFTLKKK